MFLLDFGLSLPLSSCVLWVGSHVSERARDGAHLKLFHAGLFIRNIGDTVHLGLGLQHTRNLRCQEFEKKICIIVQRRAFNSFAAAGVF